MQKGTRILCMVLAALFLLSGAVSILVAML